jgi:hypothetical protein
METIRNALRKKNKEYIELARFKPLTDEGTKKMEILSQDIEQHGQHVW